MAFHLFKRRVKQNDTVSNIAMVPEGWFTIAGVSDNSIKTFEKSTWFFTCVRVKAETAAQVPLKIYNEKGEEVPDVEKYFRKPNQYFTWRETMERIIAWLDIKGKSYVLIPKGTHNMYVLDSDLVVPFMGPQGFTKFNYYVGNGQVVEYSPDEIVVFYNFNPYTRLTRLSNLEILKQSINLSYNADAVAEKFFEKGAVLQGFLRSDQPLREQDIKLLQKIWAARYGGSENAWNIPILGKGLDFVKTALTPGDYEALNLEKVTKNRISTVEGVPSVLLNDTENLNYATAETQKKMFWENTLIPLLSKIEERITYFVLPKWGTGLVAQFDYSGVKALREDYSKKVEDAVKLYQMGVPLNVINEKLNLGLPELPWGNDWWGPLNITQIGTGYEPDNGGKKLNVLLEKAVAAAKKKDAEKRAQIWKNFVAKTTPEENKLAKEIMKYWKKQEKFVLDYIHQQKSFKFPKSWNDVLAKLLKTYLIAFMQQAGDAQAAEFGISFDLQKPEIQRWLAAKVMTSAVEINTTTKKDVLKQLKEAVENGESIQDMDKRIKGLFEETYKHRAQTVARTEVISANNKAGLEAARQANMGHKVWITSLDERTRTFENGADFDHAKMDGVTVGIDEKFAVPSVFGDEYLDFPGDPSGSPGDIINCRCTMTYAP